MPQTARAHFDEDISRALTLLNLSEVMGRNGRSARLVQDVRQSSVAMAVGALDAYLCDAFVDCFSSVLKAYRGGNWKGELPAAYAKQYLPAGIVLDSSREHRPNWAIRMAARKIMEKDNMLSISRLEDSFNPILPLSAKIWVDLIPVLASIGSNRLRGPKNWIQIQALSGKSREKATKAAISAARKRLGKIIQVRHDWIHNCGRPKLAIQTYSKGQSKEYIRDVKAVIECLDDHIEQHRLVK